MGFDHLGFSVANFLKSRDFYVSALAPLDIAVIGEPPGRIHVAFRARDRAAVNAFHAAATEAGGVDNGAPGPRPEYHPGYYAAFVLDPDGHNIEAVVHEKA
ncbi:MAG: VOC family protein [Rhizobiales bacterium]|nr:VOC family protein [Hyphomicrobiales bacterium]